MLVAASDALGLGRVGTSLSKRKVTRSSEEHALPPSSFSQTTLAESQLQPQNAARQQRKLLPWIGKPKAMKGHWALQPPSSSQLMSDVIEISAAANTAASSIRDDEEESERRERERLREAAAESIGISPLIREDTSSRTNNSEDNFFDETETQDDIPTSSAHEDARELGTDTMPGSEAELSSMLHTHLHRSGLGLGARHTRSSSLSGVGTPTIDSSPLGNYGSLTPKSSLPASLVQSQSNIPIFPCTLSGLDPFSVRTSSVLKFYPSSTLLSRGFSRLWRNRVLVLTTSSSPGKTTGLIRSFAQERLSYVHLFKSSGPDERELERMVITPDTSSTTLMEQDFAGKRFAIKIGGTDVSGRRKESNDGESDHTTWFLALSDLEEAQSLIATLKDAVAEKKYVLN